LWKKLSLMKLAKKLPKVRHLLHLISGSRILYSGTKVKKDNEGNDVVEEEVIDA